MNQISASLQNILNSGAHTPKEEKKTGVTDMGMMDFLNLFIAQLQNQDPLEPMDNNQLTSQTSQFSMVEQLVKIGDSVTKLAEGDSNNNSLDSLFSASSFIGKIVEFEGNTALFNGEGAYMDFNLESPSYKTEIFVYDSSGNLINNVQAGQLNAGKNSIVWNGKNSEGEVVAAGQYKFVVKAYNSSGQEIDTKTFGNGYVSGVSQESGKIVFDLMGTELSADKVTAVKSY